MSTVAPPQQEMQAAHITAWAAHGKVSETVTVGPLPRPPPPGAGFAQVAVKASSINVDDVFLLEGHPRLSVVAIASSQNVIQLLDFRNPETPLTQDISFLPTALQWESTTRLVAIGEQERRTFEFKTTDIGGAWNRLISPVHYEGYEAPAYLWLPLPASEVRLRHSLQDIFSPASRPPPHPSEVCTLRCLTHHGILSESLTSPSQALLVFLPAGPPSCFD